MNTSDPALVDTNVLVYAADTTTAFYEPSKQLRDRGLRSELTLVVSPQVLMEFFAVITDIEQVQSTKKSFTFR
jgi:predicted nucleic acid-binding protein